MNVTKVSPSDDIEGINNFDIFVIQEGAKTSGKSRDKRMLAIPPVSPLAGLISKRFGANIRVRLHLTYSGETIACILYI